LEALPHVETNWTQNHSLVVLTLAVLGLTKRYLTFHLLREKNLLGLTRGGQRTNLKWRELNRERKGEKGWDGYLPKEKVKHP